MLAGGDAGRRRGGGADISWKNNDLLICADYHSDSNEGIHFYRKYTLWVNDMRNDWMEKSAEELPKYMQVSKILSEEIQNLYRPGDVLPSEHELAKRFNVNRHTLRMAVELLVTSGMVGKYQGKGTIVQQQVINYPIHAGTRFTETLEGAGRKAENQVLRKRGIPALKEVAEALEIEEDDPVILVEALGKMDGAPFLVSSHYFPLETMFEVMRRYESGSLHAFVSECYSVKLKRTMSLISAILPDHDDSRILEISANSPVLRVKSVNVDVETGIPVEFVVTRFKGLSTELSVHPGYQQET